MGVFAQRYANQYLREDNAFTERVNGLTFSLMCINITLIISKSQDILDVRGVAVLFFFVVMFFFLKSVIIWFLGILFKANDIAKLAVFFSLLFDKALGLLLFPLLVVSYFFLFDMFSFVFGLALFLVISFMALKFFWIWKIAANSFGLPRLYIFLYLCILEIFPILLLVKKGDF